ncbi:hypothetical protein [Citricoccus sp. NR2]|uniref:hypothetical protein n=1 Tax=Citricoccus sp. NR2 TaxID=3004095 RepID=UPI0022DDDEDE|nr:hypothetical protein [Citricoccus sp. NR2]WBL17824.1 hypothetical protein O1A05_08360 [Citricoccus sp. NR2]
MRHVLAALLAVLSGVLAVLAVASYRIDAVLHTPEPLQQIAASSAEGQALREAAPELVGSAAGQALEDVAPGFAADMVSQVTGSLAGNIVADEGFDQAWSASLEQTRTGWVEQLRAIRTELDAGREVPDDAAQLDLDIGPLAQLSAEVLTSSLRDAVSGLPFGDQIGAMIDDAVAEVPDDLSVTTGFPATEDVSPRQLAFVESVVGYWMWAAGAAVVLFLVALMVAPYRGRSLVWLFGGAAVLAGGAAARWWLQEQFTQATTAAEGTAESAMVEALVGGFRSVLLPDTMWVMVGGAAAVFIGLITAAVTAMTRR